ncbi:DUF6193 family natural product biosynthesis protein [Streptomyces amritsarensis]|uniref:DUF6193 family natural product biosynthesis protein n=1 Tax=Streptomyces amritsarensis TaxID=681158 RepID=UPI0036B15B5A
MRISSTGPVRELVEAAFAEPRLRALSPGASVYWLRFSRRAAPVPEGFGEEVAGRRVALGLGFSAVYAWTKPSSSHGGDGLWVSEARRRLCYDAD